MIKTLKEMIAAEERIDALELEVKAANKRGDDMYSAMVKASIECDDLQAKLDKAEQVMRDNGWESDDE